MRVQLTSPDLYKHLGFLSSSSIKENKQEIPESHWLKPRLFTTTPLLLHPIQMCTIPTPPCTVTFNLRTARNTPATLMDSDRGLEFAKAIRQQPSSGIGHRGHRLGGSRRRRTLKEIWHQITARSPWRETFKCVQDKWGSLKGWKEISELDSCPTPSSSPSRGGTGFVLNTDARVKHIWRGRVCVISINIYYISELFFDIF